ncbi:hypothetical protein D5R93_02225 [Actinomyces lilanjuaniae]|uniref:AAA domain-containing protein n=1 Tax=Actinomyces lilanjuaniae TaxID=2321394 RepID=A0ABN5PQ47_9ACTO|nr:AAA family ATPase [Actinomyces lilanjuaniae]AYD89164.1 hypothetical protein D5R93_02225 [Actinomyces lilanjuaniae]
MTTVNLAHRLTVAGLRVLVVDSDPQANATSILDAVARELVGTVTAP